MTKRILLITFAVLFFLFAVLLMTYPLISNYVNDKYQSVVRTDYTRKIEEKDESEIQAAREAALIYNERLAPLQYNREGVEAASLRYDELLNLSGGGIMGYIEIPNRSIHLPIYHGTSEDILQHGVGHLIGSSLPIGGTGCHTVLTGHSGVAGKKLFSDIDKMASGEVIYLHVLNETLAYEVTEINTVLPYQTELLEPVRGKDLCTLVTCYPFGVNTHRLMVRCERIPYAQAEEQVRQIEENGIPAESTWQEQYVKGLLIGGCSAGVAAVLWISLLLFRRIRRKHREAA